jgi:hypothetical protein
MVGSVLQRCANDDSMPLKLRTTLELPERIGADRKNIRTVHTWPAGEALSGRETSMSFLREVRMSLQG